MNMMLWSSVLVLLTAVAADQYEQQSLGGHRFQRPQVPELQVGCEHGSDHHNHITPQVLARHRRQVNQRRDYIQWYGTSSYQQPSYVQSYRIQSQVPYYIPIWGNPSRIPVFFPAKPVLFNPGYPVRNPPANKPITEKPPVTDGGTTVNIGNRINVDDDDRPVWGIVEADNNAGSAAPPQNSVGSSRPTRPPTPPLLHRPSLSDRFEPNPPQRPPVNANEIPSNQFRPQTTTTTQRPTTSSAPQGTDEPSRCVWAIISCCNPTNTQISYSCFERVGCPGAFWGSNPCSRENTAAALNAAAKFYEQR